MRSSRKVDVILNLTTSKFKRILIAREIKCLLVSEDKLLNEKVVFECYLLLLCCGIQLVYIILRVYTHNL